MILNGTGFGILANHSLVMASYISRANAAIIDFRLLRNLPLSSMARIVRAPGGKNGKLRPVTEKVRLPVPYVIAGSQTVTLRVTR